MGMHHADECITHSKLYDFCELDSAVSEFSTKWQIYVKKYVGQIEIISSI
jgi:hypothetical protein